MICAILALLVSACSGEQTSGPYVPPGQQNSYTQVVAEYLYQGEPLTLDYVYACGRTSYYGVTGVSSWSGINPVYMIWALPDGSAAMLHTPRVCGASVDEQIPPSFMPRLMWFDDASDLAYGLVYATERAYLAEHSRFEFLGASYTQVGEDVWKSWAQRASDAYEQVGALPGPWGVPEGFDNAEHREKFGTMILPLGGSGYTRHPVPENLWAEIEPLWPEDNRKYWAIYHPGRSDGDAETVWTILKSRLGLSYYPDGTILLNYNYGKSGTQRLEDGALLKSENLIARFPPNNTLRPASSVQHYLAPDLYPLFPYSRSIENPDEVPDKYYWDLKFEEGWNGFLSKPGIGSLVGHPIDTVRPGLGMALGDNSFDPLAHTKTHEIRINGIPVRPGLVFPVVPDNGPEYLTLNFPSYILDRDGWYFGTGG